MTQKLFWEDQYLKQFTASIVNNDGNNLILDKTAFYPTGGGQPCDTGIISFKGKEYKVVSVSKKGNDIVHALEEHIPAEINDSVEGTIDWDKRYSHMRLHTALHTLDGVMEKIYRIGKITGNQIYDERARIDLDIDGATREKMAELVEATNKVLAEGHEVVARIISREEALANPELVRAETGLAIIKSVPEVRTIEIVGLDIQTDGGTHVKNTKEVGKMVLSNYLSKGTHNKRIEIILE